VTPPDTSPHPSPLESQEASTALAALLTDAAQALDDWITTHASVFCTTAAVQDARARIARHGGTLYYAATLRQRLRAAAATELQRASSFNRTR